ncbi:RNA polymerase sigma factor [Kineosporia babensis]|uniref:RNA polymerase sigma factor n=1 Tax=Kineosporia babensis TaxID=499548 RepID=A0A9X1NDX3_9ACTN|nr:RNA polymerase sigma factor [Kineosporia babensis]MCD5311971.1 RNA polymerase sigma factor [Kineosporia babensis]
MGDQDDFEELFQRHYPKVLAYASRRTEASRAHDVVAQTFTAAWLHFDRLPPEPLPWLYRTAANHLANENRSSRRQERLAARLRGRRSTPVPDPAVQVVEDDHLRAALRALDPVGREALLLISWEELDYADAAAAMGCSVATFRVRVHRARRKLEQLLAMDPIGQEAADLAVTPTIPAHPGGASDA